MNLAWSYDPGPPKPHVHPLRAPNGRVLTRAETPDHPWQRGLWFALKFVDRGDERTNFWEELGGHGEQHHRDDATVEWVRPGSDGDEVVLVEDRRLEVADDHTLDWTTTLTAGDDLVLDRTPYQGWGGYGGLALRGAGDWTGTRLAVEGAQGPALVGVRSRWCDLSGPDAGVTILDHPDNPRHPVPWYADVANPLYDTEEPTNFVNAAFLFHDPLALAAGTTLRIRHRIVVHDGVPAFRPDRATRWWEAFARA